MSRTSLITNLATKAIRVFSSNVVQQPAYIASAAKVPLSVQDPNFTMETILAKSPHLLADPFTGEQYSQAHLKALLGDDFFAGE